MKVFVLDLKYVSCLTTVCNSVISFKHMITFPTVVNFNFEMKLSKTFGAKFEFCVYFLTFMFIMCMDTLGLFGIQKNISLENTSQTMKFEL